jgi:hypothetical protein
MPYPGTPFGLATSPEPMSALDALANGIAAGTSVPCSATGTNGISLTPLSGFPALTSYTELVGFRFVAVGNSTGAVTAQYNGLGFLPVYHADGVTQANVADLVSGQQYIVTFHQALNGALGGFFLESPSLPVVTQPWSTPGGRLTLVSATPVLFSSQTTIQGIFYAPYRHPFAPIYNGSSIQMYQFTSSLADQVGLGLSLGGSANFPSGANFDIFIFLVGATPTLGAVQWTNPTTRALSLSVFGGFLTNAGVATMLTGPSTSQSVPINQGTFLGTFNCSANGQTEWVFGAAASGGSAARFRLCNYYNKVLFTTSVVDNGASYTYTSATARQARASSGNQITYVQSDSEAAMLFSYTTVETLAGIVNATALVGLGVNATNTFATFVGQNNNAAVNLAGWNHVTLPLSQTGLGFVAALEGSDGANANTFDTSSVNRLSASLWL